MSIKFQKRQCKLSVAIICVILLSFATGCVYYSLPPYLFFTQLTRIVAAPVFAALYASDIRDLESIISRYKVGETDRSAADSAQTWRNLEATIPGFQLLGITPTSTPRRKVSFVYETADAEYLRRFREAYDLDSVIRGAKSQYEAMLGLGAWIGTRWDHGTDPLTGSRHACDPARLVAAGELGAKFWCEIAARITVQAASSLGWPARVITASRDGYAWDHGVAELWSDDFGKWFVMDTDFNVIYANGGVPLSAFELSREGLALQHSGKLDVIAIAPPKPSLILDGADMVAYYRYIHIDMRNDWCSRPLRRGSPAGGDLATWWMAQPDIQPILTAKLRVDDADSFDWPLNSVAISAVGARLQNDGDLLVEVALSAESPVFSHFETSLDKGSWEPVEGTTASWVLDAGMHTISARMVTAAGYTGRTAFVNFRLKNQKKVDYL